MPLPVVHLCPYNFQSSDPVVIGNELDGGTSISGISEVIQTDGGGYWQWTLSSASFGGRQEDRRNKTLDWRALNGQLAGGKSAIFLFCDRHHQPVNPTKRGPWDPIDGTPTSIGAEASVLAVVNGQTGGLNCTILDISIVSERHLRAGMRFTHVHSTWLDRCYEIASVENIPGGKRIAFYPPIRGGIAAGDDLDFNNPRCVMRRQSAPTNALNPFSQVTTINNFVLVEDMRDPDA